MDDKKGDETETVKMAKVERAVRGGMRLTGDAPCTKSHV